MLSFIMWLLIFVPPPDGSVSASCFRGRQLTFSKYLFMTIIAVKSPQGPVRSSDTVKQETGTWIRLSSHTWISKIFGVHRRTQRVTTWESSVLTLSTYSMTSRDLFHFVVVKMMMCHVGNIDNGRESKQNLVWRINSNSRFSVFPS